ncbi:hypothetical protein CDL15_Pgr000482 [Punica granatum]|uniref:Uncharacterized protein n=1 Tax=Punica granatum TaxID=22663 RepID=A0A218W3Z0_PUNGR|nr:hypothetical protein CDL15_Pgr000482 [Punica granatum]
MGLLLRSLAMHVILLLCCLFGPLLNLGVAQSTTSLSIGPARALDMLLQDYAYRAFVRPRTGIPYDGTVPSNLTGISISAMRLRSGSLKTRGVQRYKEFEIPTGVTEEPYVERLVLVYQNLGNWSMTYYALPGYTYLTPVLGLLAYDAANLSATNLSELNIRATGNPILIHFADADSPPAGSSPKCVWISLNGSVNFSSPISGSICSTVEQGHFSIVVESIAPSPAPVSPAPVSPAPIPTGGGGEGPPEAGPPSRGNGNGNRTKVWIIVGSVVGGLALFALLGFLVLWAQKFEQRKKMQQMERAADVGEALRMASVGPTKAPSAMVTRTQPVLETEYVP